MTLRIRNVLLILLGVAGRRIGDRLARVEALLARARSNDDADTR